jgi:hypothetical protein
MGVLFAPDKDPVEVTPENGKKFTLLEAQMLVGGHWGKVYLEPVILPKGTKYQDKKIGMFLVDEEGLLKENNELNVNAVRLDGERRPLFGNALLTWPREF